MRVSISAIGSVILINSCSSSYRIPSLGRVEMNGYQLALRTPGM
jgi:hypothetical protein